MGIISLLAKENFIMTNKKLASKIGLTQASLFGELCSRYSYWASKGELTEEGFFFVTIEDIENATCIKRREQERLFKELVNCGLIEVKRIGLPAKRHVRILKTEYLEGVYIDG